MRECACVCAWMCMWRVSRYGNRNTPPPPQKEVEKIIKWISFCSFIDSWIRKQEVWGKGKGKGKRKGETELEGSPSFTLIIIISPLLKIIFLNSHLPTKKKTCFRLWRVFSALSTHLMYQEDLERVHQISEKCRDVAALSQCHDPPVLLGCGEQLKDLRQQLKDDLEKRSQVLGFGLQLHTAVERVSEIKLFSFFLSDKCELTIG